MSPSTEMYTKATRRIHRVLHTTHIRFYTRFYRRNWLIATCHGKRGIPETNEESTTLMVSPGIYQSHSDGPSRKGIVRVTGIRRKLAFCTYRVPHTAKNLESSDASWKRQRRVSAPFRIFPWERLRQVAPDLQKIMAYLRYWEKPGRRDGVDDEKRKIQKYSFQEDNSHKTLD